jgi:glycosyltransferase involved in cell wall biosynthesis
MARLLQDDTLRMRLGRQAEAWAQNYTWPRVADQLIGVFEAEQNARVPAFA